jgi:hypothetical protein
MELKYVRHSEIGFVLWPRTDDLWHSHVGAVASRNGGGIVSAGFCTVAGGVARCWGKSESLGIGSRPDDSKELAAQFGLTAGPSK